jgi:thymidine phosphorylase
MDVKVGSGAFLPALDAARDLASSLVEVANGAGLRCSALLTDMGQCLGRTAGNALEVREAIDLLAGRASDPRLRDVTLALCAELLVLCGLEEDRTAARARAEQALASGKAAERFSRMVRALGGPSDLLERPDAHLPAAPVRLPVDLGRAGIVSAMDARALGLAVVTLGGGRRAPIDRIDHAVGLAEVKGVGETVGPGQPFAIVHARTEDAAEAAAQTASAAVELGEAGGATAVVIESLDDRSRAG